MHIISYLAVVVAFNRTSVIYYYWNIYFYKKIHLQRCINNYAVIIKSSFYKHFCFFGQLNKTNPLFQVRICRPHTSPLSEVAIFTWKMHTVLNRMKNHNQIFPIFSFWVMADCIYNLRWHTKCAFNQKKNCSNVTKFTGKMRIALTIIF